MGKPIQEFKSNRKPSPEEDKKKQSKTKEGGVKSTLELTLSVKVIEYRGQ
jgi:hypothetical protein